ncbi:MAG TPA: type II toxin-antitoxin system Phd/YefM family antitoxin [Fimbriimonadaceae bacterium]
MQTISVTEFKAHCLELIKQVKASGDPLLLTNRGEVTAMLCPPPKAEKKKWVFGSLRDEIEILGDLVEPTGEVWDAEL